MELLRRWYHENSWEFTGKYWALKGHPASSQGGSPGSSPLRSDGWMKDDQAGEAGLVEQSSAEARVSKLEVKGLSGCHPSGQQPRQPDGKARGQIKDYSHDNLRKNTELKAALTSSTVRQKSVMSDNQNSQSQVHATASRYLMFKPRKRGLNSPFTCPEWGGFSPIT
jgi:hypothetical protein